jgi:hypothetical protein
MTFYDDIGGIPGMVVKNYPKIMDHVYLQVSLFHLVTCAYLFFKVLTSTTRFVIVNRTKCWPDTCVMETYGVFGVVYVVSVGAGGYKLKQGGCTRCDE